jgi:hypothetical protein
MGFFLTFGTTNPHYPMPAVANPGFDPLEIKQFKEECRRENRSFLYTTDEEIDEPTGDEFAHFQFVGTYEGKEVIYDSVMYTLRLHHSSLVYEEAERRAVKAFPLYVPLDMRDETYQANEDLDEEVELLITELIEEIEDTEEIKVQEHLELDPEVKYGVELDVCLNVEAIDEAVISRFITEFNDGTLSLDNTLYAFKSEEEE